jgi:hypothetical protein
MHGQPRTGERFAQMTIDVVEDAFHVLRAKVTANNVERPPLA